MANPNLSKKTDGERGNRDVIEYIVPGDYNRHMMIADVANEVIKKLNTIWNVKGGNHIKIDKSDANMVISYVDNKQKQGGQPETNTGTPNSSTSVVSSSLNWKSQWQGNAETGISTADYFVGDIVRRTLDSEYDSGNVVGTYICIKDAPAGTAGPIMTDQGRVGDSIFWEVFSPFATQKFVMISDDGLEKIEFNTRGDNPTMIKMYRVSEGNIEIVLEDAEGLHVVLRPVNVCEGETKQRIFLESDTPLP